MTLDRPLNREADREQQRVARIDDDYFALIKNLGQQVVDPGGLVKFDRTSAGGMYLAAGRYAGATLSGTSQRIDCAPGVVFTRQVTVDGSVTIVGANFVCSDNTPAIVVDEGGSLMLIGCRIQKGDGLQVAATDRYITVNTGGYATLSSCVFTGDQATVGTIVTNEDAANPQRVAVRACMNYTGIVAASRYTNVGSIQDIAIP